MLPDGFSDELWICAIAVLCGALVSSLQALRTPTKECLRASLGSSIIQFRNVSPEILDRELVDAYALARRGWRRFVWNLAFYASTLPSALLTGDIVRAMWPRLQYRREVTVVIVVATAGVGMYLVSKLENRALLRYLKRLHNERSGQ